MLGSRYIHHTSELNMATEDEDSSKDFDNSDGEEINTNSTGLQRTKSQHLGTLLHVFKVII